MNRLETINTLPIEIAQLLGNDTQLQQLKQQILNTIQHIQQ